jgi:putative tricarboxylic transport membrane protein
LLISDGSFNFLWDRPLTAIILVFTISIISWQAYKSFKK